MARRTESISLFGDGHGRAPGPLKAVKMSFIEAEDTTWQELFGGFRKLYAITYSTSLSFISQLLGLFEEAEVILGSERIVQADMAELMAFQKQTNSELREMLSKQGQPLLDLIERGNLRFYTSRHRISHEKIYILEGDRGSRVVTGSANMSYMAFGGRQRENIFFLDDEQAYHYFVDNFARLKQEAADYVSYAAIKNAESEDVEHLPVLSVPKVLILEPPDEECQKQARFALQVERQSRSMRPIAPSAEKGMINLTAQSISTVKREYRQVRREVAATQPDNPRLILDTRNQSATLNDEPLDLFPDQESVRRDTLLFIDYMKGFERFHGDTSTMLQRYFAFANWFFASPLMATMRDYARKVNLTTNPYPVFGLLYGKSKGGKTSFLETLTLMMIGQKLTLQADQFTRTNIDTLKSSVRGVPIVVDDLTNTRFSQHGPEIIKNELFGLNTGDCNYPAVVISANEDVKVVAPEIARRTVICQIQASLTNMEIMKSSLVRQVQGSVGTGFYRCYLQRMLVELPGLLNQMHIRDLNSPPDILQVSSHVIMELIETYHPGPLPPWARRLQMDDYFSEKVIRGRVISDMQKQWEIKPEALQIRRKQNELIYDAGDTVEARRLMKELPENLSPRMLRTSIVMDLQKAEEFFELQFDNRPNWLRRLLHK